MREAQWLWEFKNIPKRNRNKTEVCAPLFFFVRSFSFWIKTYQRCVKLSRVMKHFLRCTISRYTVTRDLARLIFQVMINFWSRPGTQLVITTLIVKSGRTRSHITSKEETRRVWLSVITCWRITMAWRKWSTLYQKIMSCYRSVYTEISCVSSRLPVIYNFKLLCLLKK